MTENELENKLNLAADAMAKYVSIKAKFDASELEVKRLRTDLIMAGVTISAVCDILVQKRILSENQLFDLMTELLEGVNEGYRQEIGQHIEADKHTAPLNKPENGKL